MNLKAKKANTAKAFPEDTLLIGVGDSLLDWEELDPERAAEYLRLKNHAAEIIDSLRPIHDAMHALRMDSVQEYRNAQPQKTGEKTTC